jgi:peptide/nickel transport system ATP-binding protein
MCVAGSPEQHATRPPMLQAEDLHKSFDVSTPFLARVAAGEPRRFLRAVAGVSFAVDRGETMSLVGESGCGKSTVARLVTGLHRPDHGRVLIDGTDVTALKGRRALKPFGRRLQMIFQDPYASMNPRWRVRDIVAEPIRAFRLAPDNAAAEARVTELLEQVGLTAADKDKFPHEFSGGQRQRISIARALASEPEFLVCDEPTSALDVSIQAQILNLLAELQERLRLGYLFISHNLAVVYHVSHKIGVMYLGRLVETGPSQQVFARPRHPYTRLLMDTIPRVDAPRRSRAPIAGEVPSPIDPPPGCVFHPRCPFARERCRSEAPKPTRVEGVTVACHGIAEGWIDEPKSTESAMLAQANANQEKP